MRTLAGVAWAAGVVRGAGVAMRFGVPHRHYRRTDSTNDRARELVEVGAPGGTVVTAAEQTAGRGRQGRTWTASAGKALLYSAVLRPLDERHLLLPLAVPLAVCEAAEELAPGIECAIKWPNDVWVEGRKLAGVLIEAKPQDGWAVIGVGLNLTIEPDEFPPDLRETAVSLFDRSAESRGEVSSGASRSGPGRVAPAAKRHRISPPKAVTGTRRDLPSAPLTAAGALNRRLSRWVTAPRDAILAAWRERDALRGREVSWDGGAGVADGIADSGDLLVAVAGGDRIVLGAGEVHLRL
jgi:BirA family transcriptional regulator, biotin operon repressor / biotin---[acetyl-CoA-carboxylase] ligase